MSYVFCLADKGFDAEAELRAACADMHVNIAAAKMLAELKSVSWLGTRPLRHFRVEWRNNVFEFHLHDHSCFVHSVLGPAGRVVFELVIVRPDSTSTPYFQREVAHRIRAKSRSVKGVKVT